MFNIIVFLIYRFNTEDEALAIANASNVGLAGEYIPLSSCSQKTPRNTELDVKFKNNLNAFSVQTRLIVSVQ